VAVLTLAPWGTATNIVDRICCHTAQGAKASTGIGLTTLATHVVASILTMILCINKAALPKVVWVVAALTLAPWVAKI
jgi:hypothetical protein